MERTAIILQCLLVLLVTKHVDSTASSCVCTFVTSFCTEGITALQGKVLDSKLANKFGQSVSGRSNAQEARYHIKLVRLILEGSYSLAMANKTFTISYPLRDACESGVKSNIGREVIFIGHVDREGRFCKPVCYMPLESNGEDNYEVLPDGSMIKELCDAISIP